MGENIKVLRPRERLISLLVLLTGLACSLPGIIAPAPPQPAVGESPDPMATVDLSAVPTIATDYSSASPWSNATEPLAISPAAAPPTQEQKGLPAVVGDGVTVETAVLLDGTAVTVIPPAASALNLLVVPLSAFDLVVEVSAANGDSLGRFDERGSGEPEIVALPLEQPGRLTVRISGSPTGRDRARLAVFESAADMFEPLLAVEDAVAEDEVNRHKVQLTAGRPVVIRLEPDDDSDLIMELYDSAAIVIGVDDGFDGEAEQLLFTPRETAEHVLTVYGFKFQGGSYRLTVNQLK